VISAGKSANGSTSQVGRHRPPLVQSERRSSIDAMDAAENGRPPSFMMPRAASSAEIARSDMRPPEKQDKKG
jgi:hypothetical protein